MPSKFSKRVLDDALWGCGTAGHSPCHFSVRAEENSWHLATRAQDLSSRAKAIGVNIEYAAKKLKLAAEFIDAFPKFEHKEDWKDAPTYFGGASSTPRPRSSRVRRSNPGNIVQMPWTSSRRFGLQMVFEKFTPNRLDDSWTQDMIQKVCNQMYDMLDQKSENENSTLSVGSVEAALMAWDLSSEIEGAWRVPLTIATMCNKLHFAYVCVLVVLGDQLAALGRSEISELSYVPLARQRTSDVVEYFVTKLTKFGHDIQTLHLGLPAKCPTSLHEAATQPVIWRYLKLSCVRQQWKSILACCDSFVSQRNAIRRAVLCRGDPPSGFKKFDNNRGEPRLKANEPLLVRQRQRPEQRMALRLGVGGGADAQCSTEISDAGVWNAESHSLQCSLQGAKGILRADCCSAEFEDCLSVSSASMEEYCEIRPLELLSDSAPTTPSKIKRWHNIWET